MQGKMVYIIYGQHRITQEGNFYFHAPDKLRIDFIKPVSTSIVQIGKQNYLKSFNQSKYIKVSENNTVYNQSDLFGFTYLSRFNYNINKNLKVQDKGSNIKEEDRPADLKTSQVIAPVYYGFQIENNEKILSVVINYNKDKDIISSYKLIGNETMPQSTVQLKRYKKIKGIQIPHRMDISLRLSSASVKSIIILRNVRLNEEIKDEIFTVVE